MVFITLFLPLQRRLRHRPLHGRPLWAPDDLTILRRSHLDRWPDLRLHHWRAVSSTEGMRPILVRDRRPRAEVQPQSADGDQEDNAVLAALRQLRRSCADAKVTRKMTGCFSRKVFFEKELQRQILCSLKKKNYRSGFSMKRKRIHFSSLQRIFLKFLPCKTQYVCKVLSKIDGNRILRTYRRAKVNFAQRQQAGNPTILFYSRLSDCTSRSGAKKYIRRVFPPPNLNSHSFSFIFLFPLFFTYCCHWFQNVFRPEWTFWESSYKLRGREHTSQDQRSVLERRGEKQKPKRGQEERESHFPGNARKEEKWWDINEKKVAIFRRQQLRKENDFKTYFICFN